MKNTPAFVPIDAHQHFWNPARGDYDWMPKDNKILNRTYWPPDLEPELNNLGVHRTILVQAAASVEETEYMLGIADATQFVAGVVGWVNFENPEHLRHLERFAKHEKFVGVRPMIHDIPDPDWMLREELSWAYQAVIDLGLCFDALGYPEHLKNFHELFRRYSAMHSVIDHCMKPRIKSGDQQELKSWKSGIARIASETSAFCKLSGLVTEVDGTWSVGLLVPYANHVLGCFGPNRLMWGSDWPVCKLKADYSEWHRAAQILTEHLPDADRNRVFGGTAHDFYFGGAP